MTYPCRVSTAQQTAVHGQSATGAHPTPLVTSRIRNTPHHLHPARCSQQAMGACHAAAHSWGYPKLKTHGSTAQPAVTSPSMQPALQLWQHFDRSAHHPSPGWSTQLRWRWSLQHWPQPATEQGCRVVAAPVPVVLPPARNMNHHTAHTCTDIHSTGEACLGAAAAVADRTLILA